jgi:hypothetical protein
LERAKARWVCPFVYRVNCLLPYSYLHLCTTVFPPPPTSLAAAHQAPGKRGGGVTSSFPTLTLVTVVPPLQSSGPRTWATLINFSTLYKRGPTPHGRPSELPLCSGGNKIVPCTLPIIFDAKNLAFQIPLEGLWKIEKSRNSLKVLRVMYIVLGSA